MGHKKLVNLGIALFVFQMIGVGAWFYIKRPGSSYSMEVFKIVPILFGINLVIGLVLYFLKKRISNLILANAIICPLIFYAGWILWFTYYAN